MLMQNWLDKSVKIVYNIITEKVAGYKIALWSVETDR